MKKPQHGKNMRIKKRLMKLARENHDARDVAHQLQGEAKCPQRWLRFQVMSIPMQGAVLYCRSCGVRIQVNLHDP